ncbi:DNA-binding response regulator OS=Streptomyces fumanus OX=67302 GN=GCM10018772_00490 PE=4 SV=1 [Streptomyces fumanus]
MRVVLAEDLFLLRDGLARLLEAHGFQIAAAVSRRELTRALAELDPDVAVVDVRLPPTHTDEGLQCALRARQGAARDAGAGALPARGAGFSRELLADGGGGVGYLLKDRVFDADQFVDAVRRVAAAVRRWIRRSSSSC